MQVGQCKRGQCGSSRTERQGAMSLRDGRAEELRDSSGVEQKENGQSNRKKVVKRISLAKSNISASLRALIRGFSLFVENQKRKNVCCSHNVPLQYL